GSWFSSVLPNVLVPQIVDAISRSNALRVLVLYLSAEPGETKGFSVKRHLHVLAQHAPKLRVDRVVVNSHMQLSGSERNHIQRAAAQLGAEVVFDDVCMVTNDGLELIRHDPAKLARVFPRLPRAWT